MFFQIQNLSDASQMSPQRAMPLMCFPNEMYASQMPLICLSYASSMRDASHMPSQKTSDASQMSPQ